MLNYQLLLPVLLSYVNLKIEPSIASNILPVTIRIWAMMINKGLTREFLITSTPSRFQIFAPLLMFCSISHVSTYSKTFYLS